MTENSPKADSKVVAFRRGVGAVHLGVMDETGRVTATCGCPYGHNLLAKDVQIFPAEKVSCKRGIARYFASLDRGSTAF